MKLLQINTFANSGSTGRITNEIGALFIEKGHKSYIAYGRKNQTTSSSRLLKIGSKKDMLLHGVYTRLFDRHGFASNKATEDLISEIKNIKPDVIGLHNIHGYYLNIRILFKYLKDTGIPVIWTFHDCWPFTGHCAHFSYIGCEKWKNQCQKCPQTHIYPKSIILDNSFRNYNDKKEIFTGHPNLTLVTPSEWLKSIVQRSFLKEYPVKVINNGIDLTQFRILDKISIEEKETEDKKIILGVANSWENRKGLDDFISLSKILDKNYQIVLVGVNEKQKKRIPYNILCISQTESIEKLVELYNKADVFVNPSKEETFGMVTVEAMACGIPVIGYNLTATPELIDNKTGLVVPHGNIEKLAQAIDDVVSKKESYQYECRKKAETLFDKNDRYMDYLNLYKNIF